MCIRDSASPFPHLAHCLELRRGHGDASRSNSLGQRLGFGVRGGGVILEAPGPWVDALAPGPAPHRCLLTRGSG
eukprot:10830713-Alexandrium_andersonii.AAC.1